MSKIRPSTDRAAGWIPVDKRKPAKGQRLNALGVEVLIWPRDPDNGTAFYGRRITHAACFYKHGAVLEGVTHWMPLPKGPK